MSHLLVALSSHGFGHAAQAAAVVNALRRRLPNLRLTVRTHLPREFLARRFEGEFEFTPCDIDVGMVMSSALDVDVAATAAAYTRFHANWDRRVQGEAHTLSRLAPDLVLANVPYLALAAAAKASISAVAMCSLNWADVYAHYFFATRPEAPAIHAQILGAYHQADCFLQTEPSMPMTSLPRRVSIGPVARVGADRRTELKETLGLSPATRVIVIALGGVDMRLPLECWPHLSDVHWLVPSAWVVARPDTTAMEALGMPIADVLHSVEALVGKPGYGTFTEAACNGTPVLYVCRPDWPEEPYLVEWLKRHATCLEITRQQLEQGDLAIPLQRLWEQPRRSPIMPAGIDQGVKFLVAKWRDDASIVNARPS